MKIIELRRHGRKTAPGDAPLSEEGVAHATQMGWEALHGKDFTQFFVSPLVRTTQTLEAFARGAGDFRLQDVAIFPPHAVSELPDAMELWNGPCHEAEKRGEDMLTCALASSPQVAKRIADASAKAFRDWIATLPENARVLVVHHSPFLELMVYGLFGVRLPQLQPLEGFRIVERSGNLKRESL